MGSWVDTLLSRKGYNPDQPRDPAGTETGGQWTRSSAARGPDTPHFVVDPERWYIRDDDPRLTVEATQRWADEMEARGWDVGELTRMDRSAGIYPQAGNFDFDPEWGMVPGQEYTAYRGGRSSELNNPNGIFFAPDQETAREYAGLEADQTVGSYTIKFDKPLYADSQFELTKKFWNRDWQSMFDSAMRRNNFDSHIANGEVDGKIAKKAKAMGYRCIVYLRPTLPAQREVVVLDPKLVRSR